VLGWEAIGRLLLLCVERGCLLHVHGLAEVAGVRVVDGVVLAGL